MEKRIKYHRPIIISENIYDVEAGGISLFGRCMCNPPPNWDGYFSSLPQSSVQTN